MEQKHQIRILKNLADHCERKDIDKQVNLYLLHLFFEEYCNKIN